MQWQKRMLHLGSESQVLMLFYRKQLLLSCPEKKDTLQTCPSSHLSHGEPIKPSNGISEYIDGAS